MIVNKIPAEIFFVNNPIFIEIYDENAKKVVVTATAEAIDKQFELTLDMYNNRVMFDVSIIGKAMLQLPRYDAIFEEQGLPLNRVYVSFVYETLDSDDNVIGTERNNMTFIRGGFVVGNNIYIQDGSKLIESERVPFWEGYPTMLAEVEGNQIIVRTILKDSEIDIQRERTCNGIYLAWLNSKGGYSYWLFEIWEIELKSDKAEVIDGYRQGVGYQSFQTTGSKSNYSINVQSTVHSEYFNHIRSLVNSPDVWIFNLENYIGYYGNLNPSTPPINNVAWKRLNNVGNVFSSNSWEKTKDVSFNFDLIRTENREVLW